MRDTLKKGELAFQYGSNLPIKNATSISAMIVTQMDATGNYTSVKFKVEFEVDPAFICAYNKPNKPPQAGNYQVNYNEVGFAENAELLGDPSLGELNVTFSDQTPMLNLYVPLADPIKRDSETFELHSVKKIKK